MAACAPCDRAREWALSCGLAAAASREEAATTHVSEQAQKQHRRYRRIVDGSGAAGDRIAQHEQQEEQHEQSHAGFEDGELRPRKRSRQDRCNRAATNRCQEQQQQQEAAAEGDAACLYDTVGCVVWAAGGGVAAGVSSGGIALKTEGRVGEAALYGAGCWAQQAQHGQQPSPAVACSVTGVGEHVMRHLLARECCLAAAAPATAQPASQQDDGAPGSDLDVPLGQLAAQLLQRTILLGPAPRDCGLLCLQAHLVNGSKAVGGSQAGTDGCQGTALPGTTRTPSVPPHALHSAEAASGVPAQVSSAGQRQEQLTGQTTQQRYAVEVAVAHTARSMAFGHMSCTPAGAVACRDGRKAAQPAVFVLRRQASDGGDSSGEPVQTYVHGVTVLV